MNKKIYALVIAWLCMLFCPLFTHAQQKLWGVTQFGGDHDGGTIFYMNKDGSAFTKYRDLREDDYNVPSGDYRNILYAQDGFLIGVETNSLEFDDNPQKATLFRVRPDGTEFAYLFKLPHPVEGTMVQGKNGRVYGMAGNVNKVFSIRPDGTDYKEFPFSVYDGLTADSTGENIYGMGNGHIVHVNGNTDQADATPVQVGNIGSGALALGPDGDLYGIASSDEPALFKVKTDGTGYQVLHTFTGPDIIFEFDEYGEGPVSMTNLIFTPSGYVVGMGGYSPFAFKIKLDGSDYQEYPITAGGFGKIIDDGDLEIYRAQGLAFNNIVPLYYAMFESDGPIYPLNMRLAEVNGMYVRGVPNPYYSRDIYSLYPERKRLFFVATGTGIGEWPKGPLINLPDGTLAGATTAWIYKLTDTGIRPVFSYSLLESGFGDFISFSNGSFYATNPVQDPYSDHVGHGELYRIAEDGSTSSVIHTFDSINGRSPKGKVIPAQGFLYGMTSEGGTHGKGVIYRLRHDGTEFEKLHDFDSLNGNRPHGFMIDAADGYLYGLTPGGGPGDHGVIFKIAYDGTGYQVIHFFDNTLGSHPYGSLHYSPNGSLYGTTTDGGANNLGTLFKISTNGSNFVVIHDFNGTDGARPKGDVIEDEDGYLYGIGKEGGANDFGMIYRIHNNGTGFTNLFNFTQESGITYGHEFSPYYTYHPSLVLAPVDAMIPDVKLSVPADGATDVAVAFNASANVITQTDAYTLQISTASDFSVITFEQTNDSSIFRVNGLAYGTTYYARVRTDLFPEYGDVTSFTTGESSLAGETKIFFPGPHGFYHMNLDGTELTHATFDGQQATVSSNGNLYGLFSKADIGGSNVNGSFFRITADGVTKLRDLGYGESDRSGVIEGSDGYFYGISPSGGCGLNPQIFRIRPDGTGFQNICNLNYFEPSDALTRLNDGSLYGVSRRGGADGLGYIYRIRANFSGIDIVYSFSNLTGKRPIGGVMEGQDGYLYGTTNTGGAMNYGVIYKVRPNGLNYTVIHSFNKKDGGYPIHGLTQDTDGSLYGMASTGATGLTVIFRLQPDGSGYTRLYDFQGVPTLPTTKLVLDEDHNLYGILERTGSHRIIFKIRTDGSNYATLADITPSGRPVFVPNGDLLLLKQGFVPNISTRVPANGSSDIGVATDVYVNSIPGALSYTLQLSLTEDFSEVSSTYNDVDTVFDIATLLPNTVYYARARSSVYPFYGPVTSFKTERGEPILWGMTTGGESDYGTIFSVKLDGSNFTLRHDFVPPAPQGARLKGSLVQRADGSLIGHYSPSREEYFTNGGLFSIQPDGSNFYLTYQGDAEPADYSLGYGGFMQASDGMLYAVGYSDHEWSGALRRINLDETGLGARTRFLHDFNGREGKNPSTPPAEGNDGYLYGMTAHGGVSNSNGVIYKIRKDGTGFQVIHGFEKPLGKNPEGSLMLGTDGYLYGMTASGGSANYGAIFKILPDGTNYTKLFDFNNQNGRRPLGELIQIDEYLYGMTPLGGRFKDGVVFRIRMDGSDYTVLHHFNGTDGSFPKGNLTVYNGFLYGMTSAGGQGGGTIFKVTTMGGLFSVLYNFNGESGTSPDGTLLLVYPQPGMPLVAPAASSQSARKVAASSESSSNIQARVFPNPSSQYFTMTIESQKAETVEYTVADLNGRILVKKEARSGETTELGHDLERGVYVLRIVQGKNVTMRRLIKK